MRITESADLAGTPDEVFALRATEAFQDEKCLRTSPREHTVAVDEQGGRTILRTTRAMPTHNLPDAARSMVGDELIVDEVQDWGPPAADGSRRAQVTIKVHGAPISLAGTLEVYPTADGSHQALEADLKAKVPFIGGKIEKAAAPAISHGFDLEAEIINDWLAAER